MEKLIRERLEELIIEKWWDYGDYEEIRDKDYVANCIYEDVLEWAQNKEEQKKLIIELGNPMNYISKGCIEYLERKYGININRTDLDNFLNREI